VFTERINKVKAEGSESPLNWEVMKYGVRVINGGMVKEVAIGGEEAQGVSRVRDQMVMARIFSRVTKRF
jgi:hypothetical protein